MTPIKKHPIIANVAELQQWIEANINTHESVDEAIMLQIAARYFAEVIVEENTLESLAELLLTGIPPVTVNLLQAALIGEDFTEDKQYYNSLEIRKAAADVLGDTQLVAEYTESISDWLWFDDH